MKLISCNTFCHSACSRAKCTFPSEIATDVGGTNVVPTISIQDVQSASKAEATGSGDTQAAGQIAIPGGLPQDVAAKIPDWYTVGWRAAANRLIESGGDLVEARHRSLLEDFVSESYFGSWYHKWVC